MDEAKTVEDLLSIYQDSDDLEAKEDALYKAIEKLREQKKYKEVVEYCLLFLNEKRWPVSKIPAAHVNLHLAYSYDQLGRQDDAITVYARTWAAYMGLIRVSAPALENWMQLVWDRNRPAKDGAISDRQAAVRAGSDFITKTERFEDKMTQTDHRLWLRVKDLTEKYEAQLKAEAEK